MTTAQGSNEVVDKLEQNQIEFRAAAAGLTDDQAKLAPQPGAWSVIECVEHVCNSEARFLSWIENPSVETAPARDRDRELKLTSMVGSRATKVQAPPPSQPTGRFSTLAEALAGFDATRERSLAFARELGADLYSRVGTHPFFGNLNGGELMLMMAAHARRHAQQIAEIRTEIRATL